MLPDRDDPETRTPVTIEARDIRGESSRGMICAEDELGLSEDHSGIMVLDDTADVGEPFIDYLHARDIEPDDAIFDIGLTPNRPDAASHLGVARDVAALTDSDLRYPEVDRPDEGGPAAEAVSVEIEDVAGCPRYVALVVRNVEIRESPLWLKRRLTAIGLRPRNNVVDITNFVMHECGQPLHAFELDRLAGPEIRVRSTTDDETSFTTLDGEERDLPEGALLICDADEPVALAGIMGGQNSEVSADTTNVLIESAYFDPSTIRRTAKALKLQTDSSYRFERGVDRDGQVWAAARAADLMTDLAAGERVPGMVDAHPEPPSARTVRLRIDRMRDVLGMDVPTDTAERLLTKIGFEVEHGDDALHCTVPTWRPDVSIEEDLIEEVARLYGYDRIPEPDTVPVPNRVPQPEAGDALRTQARRLLRGRGFREIYTNSMLPKDRAERFNEPVASGNASSEAAPVVETMNPISEEMRSMRPRLLPGALEVMQFNRNRGQKALRLFEFGHVYRTAAADEEPLVGGYHEHEALLIALTGPHAPTGWDTEERDSDFFDLKGVVETLLDDLGVLEAVTMTPRSTDPSANGRVPITSHRLDVHVPAESGDEPIGTLARVTDDVASDFDLDRPVFVAEFHWSRLAERAARVSERGTYTPVSRYPVVERDLAVLAGAGQPVGPMVETIRTTGAPLLNTVDVFDVYEGEGIEEGKKSLAFTLRFGADRTLTDEEVDDRMAAIVDALRDEHGTELRGE
jgi:phenylalanyl-tRNA synthetase beta chain